MYPRIEVEGGPAERGRQYGEAARERVQRSIEAYGDVFAHYAGWDWERVRAEAAAYRGPVEAYEPRESFPSRKEKLPRPLVSTSRTLVTLEFQMEAARAIWAW